MTKYKCKKCSKEIELSLHTMIIVNEEVVCKEAECCGEYMELIRVSGQGFGGIIKRPNGSVGGKF